MYGPYAITTWRSTNFWSGLDKQGREWVLFRDFVRKMEKTESDSTLSANALRF
jgi:hypothetical protein